MLTPRLLLAIGKDAVSNPVTWPNSRTLRQADAHGDLSGDGLDLSAYLAEVYTSIVARPAFPQLPPDPRLTRTWQDRPQVARSQPTPVDGYPPDVAGPVT